MLQIKRAVNKRPHPVGATLGVGGSIDTNKITSPVIGFILDPEGLMYNLTLEGSKITGISQ